MSFKYRSKYPIITNTPTFKLALSNMNKRDWAISIGLPLLSLPVGFAIGAPFRKPVMWGCFIVVLPAGFLLGIRDSARRLQGRRENPEEVAKYKYRLDMEPYQVRVEPLRKITEEELEEIEDNPRW